MNTVKLLALDTDVFDFIINGIAESGESASAFLRHRLGFSGSQPPVQPTAPPSSQAGRPAAPRASELEALFCSAEFRHAKGVVGRFLILLGFLYKRHRPYFDKVETIKGRGRLYFAKSEDALKDAGKSVNPKQIPDSPYWVITTSPTDLKQQMIRAVMFAFGYRTEEVRRAETAIVGAANYHVEIWDLDGTILVEHDSLAPFPDWKRGESVHVDTLKKTVEVREILDSSNEENGTVYFRRVVRVADIPAT